MRGINKKSTNKPIIDNPIVKKAMGELPFFEMDGNREVRVEGCKGVLEYSTSVIRINTNQMVTCFKGRGLNLKSLSPTSLVIVGFITSIDFTI